MSRPRLQWSVAMNPRGQSLRLTNSESEDQLRNTVRICVCSGSKRIREDHWTSIHRRRGYVAAGMVLS